MNLLRLEQVGVNRGGRAILHDIDMTINAGEIIGVIGPNGSGKTTLLRAIIGAVPVAGRMIRKKDLRIGYAPQSFVADPALPITTERFLQLPKPRPAEQIAAMLDEIGIAHLRGRQLSALSGGQIQRVLLARALLDRPELLLLDEPTRGLDQGGIDAFYRLLGATRRNSGCAMIVTGHNLHVVMKDSTRIICVNGHICCEGKPQDMPELFGEDKTMALYRHEHDHSHNDRPTAGS